MLLSFQSTVCALADSILQQRFRTTLTGPMQRHAVIAVSEYLLDLHAGMPDYLKPPLKWLTLVFDAWAIPRTGRPFHALPHELRWRQVVSWNRSHVGQFRDLMSFYDRLALFGWYSQVYQHDHYGGGGDVENN